MIKKLTAVLITLIITMSLTFTAYAENSNRIVDNADLFTAEEEQDLLNRVNDIYENKKFDVVIVTVKSTDGKSDQAYADDFYDYNGYGYGSKHDGCILLIRYTSDTDRYMHIGGTGYGEKSFNSDAIESALDEIIPNAQMGDFYSCAVEFTEIAAKKANRQYGKTLAIALIIALIISLVIVTMVKKSYKPVKFNRNAAPYLVDGSLIVNSSYDNFLYTNVTRTKIESDSSSGGSHTGSSGTSHSGGGRSF